MCRYFRDEIDGGRAMENASRDAAAEWRVFDELALDPRPAHVTPPPFRSASTLSPCSKRQALMDGTILRSSALSQSRGTLWREAQACRARRSPRTQSSVSVEQATDIRAREPSLNSHAKTGPGRPLGFGTFGLLMRKPAARTVASASSRISLSLRLEALDLETWKPAASTMRSAWPRFL